jgi:hypothetical protein
MEVMMKTLLMAAPPVRIDTAPTALSHQLRILTDDEMDKVAGGKGYGFIQPDQGGPDVFVHISAVER